MCRLFGLNAGVNEVRAAYWLLNAPDSILAESQRNRDGTGVGWFGADGGAHLVKHGKAAFDDPDFTTLATGVDAGTYVTHIRAATTGHDNKENAHPFLINGRLMAHNGGFGDLDAVDAELGRYRELVRGETDSERFAALIAKCTDDRDGDVGAGIIAAAQWLAVNVPMYSLNTIVATPGHLWALRYPDQRSLHVATRTVDPGTGSDGDAGWSGQTVASRHELRATTSDRTPVVVVASERIDDSDDWRLLDPGELVHIGPDLSISSTVAIDGPPVDFSLPAGTDHNYDEF